MRFYTANAARLHGTLVPPRLPEKGPNVTEGFAVNVPTDDAPLRRCPFKRTPRPCRSDFRRIYGKRQGAERRLLCRRQIANFADLQVHDSTFLLHSKKRRY